jgi:hypothetical protein
MEVKKLTPFTFLNSINEGRKGKHLLEDCTADDSIETPNPDAADKQYVPFIINRGLSNYKDTVLFANEMNMHASLPARMQYDFYRNIVVPKKRFAKWNKKPKVIEDIKAIQKAYNYSQEKAEAVYSMFNKDQISALHARLNKGGRA